MKTIESNEEFNDLVASGKLFVMDFYADWCGPCKMISPVVESLAQEFDGQVEIVKVNIDTNKDLANKYDVKSIPAFLFLKEDKVLDSIVGGTSSTNIRDKIHSHMG